MSQNSQDKITQLVTRLENTLAQAYNLKHANVLIDRYINSMSEDYLLDYSEDEIITDIEMMEKLSSSNQYEISFRVSQNNNEKKNIWQIKLIKLNDAVSLSRGLPILENFGFKLLDEHPYTIRTSDGASIHICDFGVLVPVRFADKIHDTKMIMYLQQAIIATFNRIMENDSLNKLVMFSYLTAREVFLLRAVAHYLVQTSLPFSYQYIVNCLCAYPDISKNLYKLFDAKFNIQKSNIEKMADIKANIINALSTVVSLDDDRILKAFLATVEAMLRVNYYQKDASGNFKPYISFKLESSKLSFLLKPLPLYEIFVYSAKFEAIHLRGGKVARGGIRWSDRREDYRTEILGLVKAQVVKNSVIVPTGSKGGFVCKKLPSINNREMYLAEGVACYKLFISGLLDLTDNIISGVIVSPLDIICYDDADPYLVVAADKGTATFSDYANAISLEYNFWLGDAFASGGSVGYDHKKIGITARGAWESAKRHFRHLGINIQSQDFTVIGIGDMSGDVFGNGMLLSKHIRLIAAFNHQHIFFDPNPDALTSFLERERLFKLPRSSWGDYDVSKISQGGGVFARSLKIIPMSNEIRALLKISATELEPNELIRALLKAEADLLYNGGIGTYVKATNESHEAAKDRINDLVRINGCELRVKVVVEGGNLGVTQLGRVEFAKNGGNIYTDAIDNSAGVDCSDHEVNIKILFADVMQKSSISLKQRNEILELMTDDVVRLVLRDNYLQTQVLRHALERTIEVFPIYVNFIEKLEKRGELDRNVEFLPSPSEVIERNRVGLGLTMPELAVLLSYSKMTLDRDLLGSNMVLEEMFEELLVDYFPKYLQINYPQEIKNHYLKKEIVANRLANLVVNCMGITFVSRFEDELRTNGLQIVRVFWIVYKLLDAQDIFAQIEALDNKIPAHLQVELLVRMKKVLERMIRWVIRNIRDEAMLMNLTRTHADDVRYLFGVLPEVIKTQDYTEVECLENKFVKSGVPLSLAQILSRSGAIPQLLDIVILTRETKRKLDSVAINYFYAGSVLKMNWLRRSLIALPENNKWQALSRSALLADAYLLYSTFIKNAIVATDGDDDNFVQVWIDKEHDRIVKINKMFDELQSYKDLDLAMLSAAVRELGAILA